MVSESYEIVVVLFQAVMKTKMMTQPEIGDSTACTGGDEDPNQDNLLLKLLGDTTQYSQLY